MIIFRYRSRSEYVDQLISDIASYYGYNEFLAEKLFHLFPVDEVCLIFLGFSSCASLIPSGRPLNSSKRMKFHDQLLFEQTHYALVVVILPKP